VSVVSAIAVRTGSRQHDGNRETRERARERREEKRENREEG